MAWSEGFDLYKGCGDLKKTIKAYQKVNLLILDEWLIRTFKWQDYVLTRLELEECDELCHGNWIEIESLQRQVAFLKKLLEENRIVLPDDYYDL